MRGMRIPIAAVLAGLFGAGVGAARADEPFLPEGAYRIAYRLELPHVERFAIEKVATVCVTGRGVGTPLFPVLSDNTPFSACRATNERRDGDRLSYDIACEGRGAARARAAYALAPDGFRARIDMTMGAKNMTMSEIQVGRRLGSCPVASADRR